jgi:hypothetical protein
MLMRHAPEPVRVPNLQLVRRAPCHEPALVVEKTDKVGSSLQM